MKQPIRFIYFDVGGVLLDWIQGLNNASTKYTVSYAEIFTIIEKHFDKVARGGDTTAYMRELANLIKLPEPFPEVADFWTNFHVPIIESHSLAIALKHSYRLGLLTNAERNAMKHAKKKKLIPDIAWNAIVDSSVHGTIKPETRIYEIAEKMAGVKPQEIFFIDDVPEHITVAKSRGWQGIVFDTNDVTQSIREIRKLLK